MILIDLKIYFKQTRVASKGSGVYMMACKTWSWILMGSEVIWGFKKTVLQVM